MNALIRRTLHVVAALAVTSAPALNAQFFQLHNAELAVAITGQFSTTLSTKNLQNLSQTQGPSAVCSVAPKSGPAAAHQAEGCSAQVVTPTTLFQPTTTDSPGVLLTFREKVFPKGSVEVNYQFTRFSERYYQAGGSGTPAAPVFFPTNMHEATSAYVLRLRKGKLSPFVAVGGGAVDFMPEVSGPSQWRGAGLVEVGVDLQTVSRLGFRAGARDLMYRAPTFGQTFVPSTWVSTEQPYAGVYVKF